MYNETESNMNEMNIVTISLQTLLSMFFQCTLQKLYGVQCGNSKAREHHMIPLVR